MRIKVALFSIVVTSIFLGCLPPSSDANDAKGERILRKGRFEVLGAGCLSCVKKIEMDLRAQKGVESAKADMTVQPPVVTVVYDMDQIKFSALTALIENQGYGIRQRQDAFFKLEPQSKNKLRLFNSPDLKPI